MKRIAQHICSWALCALLLTTTATAQHPGTSWAQLEEELNLLVANDLGRNGYYDQKTIAATMGALADSIDVECVVAPGDVHHFEGVRSTSDPLWLTNYELIYSHPELMIPWYCLLGNHEYRGNTQACIDYTHISARWNMPSRYYTLKLQTDEGTSLRLIMLDTSPLIDKYRNDATYPDAAQQDRDRQLQWLDSVLTSSSEDWVVVAGHHPIYADTGKDSSERADLQHYLNPILLKHEKKVDLYICGHIHNFQYIRPKRCTIDYVVNTSASLSRQKVNDVEGTRFKSGESGFSLLSASKQHLKLHLMDKQGNLLYSVERNKK